MQVPAIIEFARNDLVMKVCAYAGAGKFTIEEREVPEITSREILVKTKVVGVCGTDVHKAIHQTVPEGTVLGHEVSGVVERVGENVLAFKPGDKVAIQHHAPCMSCKTCLHGHHSLCDQYLETNIIPGGFSEYIRIMPENVKHTVKRMPDNVDFVEGAFMEPLSCCLRGFSKLDPFPGDNFLILGLGPIGMLFCQLAKAFNANCITGIEIDPFRLQFAKNTLGINHAFNPMMDSWDSFAVDKDIEDFDHIIITVGKGSVYQGAFDHVARGTKILFFAECPPNQEIILDPNMVYKYELVLLGSYSSAPRYLTMAMDLISNGSVAVRPLVTHIFPPEEIGKAISLAKTARESLKVMIQFQDK